MRVVRFELDQALFYGELNDDTVTQWSDAPWLSGKKLAQSHALKDVVLRAPCKPGKVIGIAINYPGASGLTGEAHEPLVFIKPTTSVIGPDQTIVCPFANVTVWGECELGIVIGKTLTNATREEAIDGIFGFTIGNDVSAENVQGRDHHLARSKAADTFSVLGPWIDSEYDPAGKRISGIHNGELLREGILDQRLAQEPELLVWLSSWMTLEPGDVILTGAPTRVRDRQFLQTGDRFDCVIEGLGTLSNDFINSGS